MRIEARPREGHALGRLRSPTGSPVMPTEIYVRPPSFNKNTSKSCQDKVLTLTGCRG